MSIGDITQKATPLCPHLNQYINKKSKISCMFQAAVGIKREKKKYFKPNATTKKKKK